MTESPPAKTDIRDTNKDVIARYRASDGKGEGLEALVLLTTSGERSGKPHTTPVCVQQDGDRLIVAGSKGGLPSHPQWYRNLLANAELTVEYRGETYRARASTVLNGPGRDALFAADEHGDSRPVRVPGPGRFHRQIPVVALERIE